MDKKSKEALRRYKKARLAARQRSSSESSSSSSDSSDSYSSGSERDRKNERRRKKKAQRSSSTSGDERRKREKRELCQKKLEAKRNHLKRKLKEAKMRKRAAVAAAVLSGHSHRSLSPNTQAKLKKLAERKHLRAQSKERREREREKLRAAARERAHSSHQDGKRQKSPPRIMHQMLTREKIIIQARTRSQTPSAERERIRHEQKLRHEDLAIARDRERRERERERERAEREAARDKERAEALARCQERQRERERIAREKMRREEEEKKYAGERGERLLPRSSERTYNSRERSMDSERRHGLPKRDIDPVYERDREYLDVDRHGIHDREELRRERDYIGGSRRDLSPAADPYAGRIRHPRDLYEEDRPYGRPPYVDEPPRHGREREAGWLPRDLHDRDIREPREFRGGVEHDVRYPEERDREHLIRERTLAGRGDWKANWTDSPTRSGERKWEDSGVPHTSRSGFIGGPKRPATSTATNPVPSREKRANSEPDWDAGEAAETPTKVETKREAPAPQRDAWVEHDHRDPPPPREKPLTIGRPVVEHLERRWPGDWRESEETGLAPIHHHRSERPLRGGFRRGIDHGYRVGPPPNLMAMPLQAPGAYGGSPRFPNKRNMTYTNPNLIKKQQALAAAKAAAAQASAVAAATTAVAAAKAAAQSAANATTNPSILGQVTPKPSATEGNEKPEAGEILPEQEESEAAAANEPKTESLPAKSAAVEDSKASGELSEISDSEDDILSKGERKSKSDLETDACNNEADTKPETPTTQAQKKSEIIEAGELVERPNEDDEMLDFEEISDGELEEEARHKGVGDALGVDWASLVEETKAQAETAAQPNVDQPTTAKEKWETHRLILDVGISLTMAGEEFAKSLIAEAQQKLQDEITAQLPEIKTEIKEEPPSTPSANDDDDSQATSAPTMDNDAENTSNSENEKKIDIKQEIKSEDDIKAEVQPEVQPEVVEEIKVEIKTEPKSEDEIKVEPAAAPNEDPIEPSPVLAEEPPIQSPAPKEEPPIQPPALKEEPPIQPPALDEDEEEAQPPDQDEGEIQPLACSQVAERQRLQEERQIFANACGPNSRALSARQDLKLRRQLCGLPTEEPNLPLHVPPTSENMREMALAAFRHTLEV